MLATFLNECPDSFRKTLHLQVDIVDLVIMYIMESPKDLISQDLKSTGP